MYTVLRDPFFAVRDKPAFEDARALLIAKSGSLAHLDELLVREHEAVGDRCVRVFHRELPPIVDADDPLPVLDVRLCKRQCVVLVDDLSGLFATRCLGLRERPVAPALRQHPSDARKLGGLFDGRLRPPGSLSVP